MKFLCKTKQYLIWLLLSIFLGGIGGTVGAAFSKTIQLVTGIRAQNSWLMFLLPIGGLLSVALYKLLRVGTTGTSSVFDAVKTNTQLPNGLAFAIFGGSTLSHLFGASVGREGAALQIGGGIASIISKLFKLDETSRRVLILCGMSSLFSALFGTPLAAAVFAIEILMTKLCFMSVLPIFLSSISAFKVALLLGVHPEQFNIGDMPQISLLFILKTAMIVIICVAVAFIWCHGLKLACKAAKNIFKNEYLRVAVGGIIIIALTVLVGSNDYNGGGVDIITRIFDEGTVKFEAFALKLLFTIICVSTGYKGGEIVPTLFIGATLGGALAVLLGLPIGIGAAVGMAVLFGCATKCPITTIFLCCEMFGFKCFILITTVVLISGAISHFYKGLYKNSNHCITYIINKVKER